MEQILTREDIPDIFLEFLDARDCTEEYIRCVGLECDERRENPMIFVSNYPPMEDWVLDAFYWNKSAKDFISLDLEWENYIGGL